MTANASQRRTAATTARQYPRTARLNELRPRDRRPRSSSGSTTSASSSSPSRRSRSTPTSTRPSSTSTRCRASDRRRRGARGACGDAGSDSRPRSGARPALEAHADAGLPARRGHARRRAHRRDPARARHGRRPERRSTGLDAEGRRLAGVGAVVHGWSSSTSRPAWTTHDVVAQLRGVPRRAPKVGHSGTLDPDATGVLLVGVGRATRLLRFLTELPKTYTGEVVLGVETSTLDAAGEVTAPTTCTRSTLEQAAPPRPRAHRRRSCRCRRWCRRCKVGRSAPARAGPRGHRGRAASRGR